MNPLFLVIFGIPALEIFLLIKIGGKIGALNTVSLIFLTAIVGIYFAKLEGIKTIKSGVMNMYQNKIPIKEIISGMVVACKNSNVSLIGGETAEMPDTYLPGEHDLVGVITGLVEKDKIISGDLISAGDVLLGLPSSGLHTNGYSLARKVFFDIGGYGINDRLDGLNSSIGLTLLEPHINYTNDVFKLLDRDINIKGMAHITGGGLVENIPRILPKNCMAIINKDAWSVLPVFNAIQSIGSIDESEMFRTFNMGIGMICIVSSDDVSSIKQLISVREIGEIVSGDGGVKVV